MPTYIATGCWFEECFGDGGWKHTNPDASTREATKHTPGFPLGGGFSLLSDAIFSHATYPAWHTGKPLAADVIPAHLFFLIVIPLFLCHQFETIIVLLTSSPDCCRQQYT